jgi:hypothetical protein
MPAPGAPIAFAFDSLDARPVSTAGVLGRPAVVAFATTYDLGSQAQVNYLVAMAAHDADAVAYLLVALEKPDDRELVEVYGRKLGVKFPVGLADAATIAGGGPFGDVHRIPTLVVLDRAGRAVWRKVGIAKSDEIRAVLRGL